VRRKHIHHRRCFGTLLVLTTLLAPATPRNGGRSVRCIEWRQLADAGRRAGLLGRAASGLGPLKRGVPAGSVPVGRRQTSRQEGLGRRASWARPLGLAARLYINCTLRRGFETRDNLAPKPNRNGGEGSGLGGVCDRASRLPSAHFMRSTAAPWHAPHGCDGG
jgi:hypothetical protein